jgi:hypothetical protein
MIKAGWTIKNQKNFKLYHRPKVLRFTLPDDDVLMLKEQVYIFQIFWLDFPNLVDRIARFQGLNSIS